MCQEIAKTGGINYRQGTRASLSALEQPEPVSK